MDDTIANKTSKFSHRGTELTAESTNQAQNSVPLCRRVRFSSDYFSVYEC